MTLLDWSEAMRRQVGMGLRARRRGPRPPGAQRAPRLEVLEDRTLLSTLTVTNNLDGIGITGSLRDTIAAANPGDTIVFAKKVHTITLTSGELQINKDLDIEGPGANKLTISGNDHSRVFDISGAVTVTLAGLTITHGKAVAEGGGIRNNGANLTLSRVILSHNQAVGSPGVSVFGVFDGAGAGGSIFNEGGATLTVVSSTLTDNLARGSDGGGIAIGGGIANGIGGVVLVTGSLLAGNQASGGSGGSGLLVGIGFGGGMGNYLGTVTIDLSLLAGNQASGGSNGSALAFTDAALGGGIASAFNIFGGDFRSTLTVTSSTFLNNQAIGGSGGSGDNPGLANGGGISSGGTATVSDSLFARNLARGGDGNRATSGFFSGAGYGAAIFTGPGFGGPSATLTVSNSTFADNLALGGDGNSASGAGLFVGTGLGGAIANDFGGSATIATSLLTGNRAQGGDGGDGLGGGVANFLGGAVRVSGGMFAHNRARGGVGGNGSGGGLLNGALNDDVSPGNFFGPSSATLSDVTVADNLALGGPGGAGLGGGLFVGPADTLTLTGSRVKKNHANGHPGIGGGIYSLGTFTFDAATDISGNHASTSNDNIFPA